MYAYLHSARSLASPGVQGRGIHSESNSSADEMDKSRFDGDDTDGISEDDENDDPTNSALLASGTKGTLATSPVITRPTA